MMAKTLFALAGFLRYAAVSLVLSALFMVTLSGAAEAQGRKLALVVGNEAYEHLPGLATPAADAQDMAKALRDLGFEVTLLTDVGPEVFQAVLTTFSKQAGPSPHQSRVESSGCPGFPPKGSGWKLPAGPESPSARDCC